MHQVKTYTTAGLIFSSPILVTTYLTRCRHLLIFGCHDDHLYCLDADTLSLQWRYHMTKAVYGTPYVYRDLVVVADTNGLLSTVRVTDGTLEGEGYSLSRDGAVTEVFSSPVAVPTGSKQWSLFLGCRDNNVYCLSL